MHQLLKTKITQLIEQEQISIAAFERRIGLNRNVVQNILRGTTKIPGYETLQTIAEACHCTVDELLDEKTTVKTSVPEISFHPQLLKDTLKWTCDFIETQNHTAPDLKQLFLLVEEIYRFSLKSSVHDVDARFAEWLIDKTLNKPTA